MQQCFHDLGDTENTDHKTAKYFSRIACYPKLRLNALGKHACFLSGRINRDIRKELVSPWVMNW